MLVLLSVSLLAVPGAGEHACTSPSRKAIFDDTTAFIQTRLEKVPGPSRQVAAPAQTKEAQEGAPKLVAQAASVPSPQTVVDATIRLAQDKIATKSASAREASMITKAGAEFIAMALFVFVGCGSAMAVANVPGYAWVLQVSLTFGFAITVLAYAIGHYSGGQINCAVTLGLVVAGHVTVLQGFVNLVAQVLGSVCGSVLTLLMFNRHGDATGGLGTNQVNRDKDKFTVWQALIGEIVGTFLLVFVVLETAVDPGNASNRVMACFAIGLAVFLAHSVLIPIDGCSINPTRSLGPAIVRTFTSHDDYTYWKDMWIFWLGPNLGAVLAALVYKIL